MGQYYLVYIQGIYFNYLLWHTKECAFEHYLLIMNNVFKLSWFKDIVSYKDHKGNERQEMVF